VNLKKDLIIAIDGYSSCGKSTVARDLARKLDYTYIDSGAMYRAVTWFAIQNNIISNHEIDLGKLRILIDKINISFRIANNSGYRVIYLNDENIDEKIRSIEVSEDVSYISKIDFVRRKMVEIQRTLGQKKRIIMDGRDIGTVVFPDADVKIFMIANVDVRAERRYRELQEKNINISFEEVKENIMQRDSIDTTREESPLIKAGDALLLDNSYMTKEEQLNWILERIGC
jgi:cytidylate kinase